jgi:enterochelin esterase-like enzyme
MTTVSLAHANLPTSETSAVDETIFARGRENADPGLTEDSQPQPDVPKGTLTKARHVGTSIYPGVGRDYWVYVPAQHDAARPANLLVVQDAGFYLRESFGAATVLDNLVARGDIPPVVAVFVEPGDLPGEAENSRGNRSIEYDTLGTAYPRFLLEELLPEVLAGLSVSTDPADRAICGMSSGGICAFNAAWEYPDSFGRVISHVGSFTNIRGGHVYPSMVRKHDPKPIRVFLQGAQNDLDREAGNWPAANFDMASALRFKGYDYRFEFGPGAHDLRHGGWTFPATLRWIWR